MLAFLIRSGLLAIAAVAAASQADARAVVIDGNPIQSFTPCTYGSSAVCQGFSTLSAVGSRNEVPATGSAPIAFTLNYGAGQQSNVYVYINGLISIGSTLSGATTTINSLAALGRDVVTPAYDPSLQVLQNSFEYSSGISNADPYSGRQFLKINYSVQFGGTTTKVQANFFQFGNPGDFVLLFGYGDFTSAPNLPDGTLIGYDLAGNLNQTTAGENRAALQNSDDIGPFQYRFVNGALVGGAAASPTPEPASWMQMLLGFGIVGIGVRRRSRPAAASAITV